MRQLQTLLEAKEQLSECLSISLQIQFDVSRDYYFSLEYPHLSKTPDIWLKINSRQ